MTDEIDIADELCELYDVHVCDLDEASLEQSALYSELSPEPERYSYKDVISKGGMKTIYNVFDPKTGRHVALAKLHSHSPEELYEPFLREARLTALLDHPNCISIHDIGLDENSIPYFTMELKTGQRFDQLIAEYHQDNEQYRPEKLSALLEAFSKICDAVAYAHSQNILHLDLKPENIQVGHYGEVVVCDWGLGKVIGDTNYDGGEFDRLLLNQDLLNNMTLIGDIKGTPGFMAPEQIQRDAEKTPQTDIYSLGAILYSIIQGGNPVDSSDTIDEMLQRTISGAIGPLSLKGNNSIVPDSLVAVCIKALALKPADRYNNVESLRADVYKYMTGYSTSAENAGIVKELQMFIRRHRGLCIMASSFIMLLAAVSVTFIYRLNQSRLEAETAKDLAEKERAASESMRLRAEQSLKMYEKEKKKLVQLNTKHSHELESVSKPYRLYFFFDDPVKYNNEALKYLTKSIKANPDNLQAIGRIGHQYYLMQQFDKAHEIFSGPHKGQYGLRRLSRMFISLSKDNNGLLSINDLAEVIRQTSNNKNSKRRHLCERMIAYDIAVRRSITNYFPAIEALVCAWNSEAPETIAFDYNKETKALRINGKGLSILQADSSHGSGKCILRFIPVKSLDISNTEVYDLNHITDLIHLKKLDIRSTLITNLKPLKHLPALHTLIINSGQFSQEQLQELPDQIEIMIK